MDSTSLTAHILFGTLAFGIVITSDLILVAIARTGQLETIRVTYEAVAKYAPVIGTCYALALLLGIHIALARHESLTSAWLLGTYVLLAIEIAFNNVVVQRRTKGILKTLKGSGGSPSSELKRLLNSTWPIGAIVTFLITAAVIALMIFKPVYE